MKPFGLSLNNFIFRHLKLGQQRVCFTTGESSNPKPNTTQTPKVKQIISQANTDVVWRAYIQGIPSSGGDWSLQDSGVFGEKTTPLVDMQIQELPK